MINLLSPKDKQQLRAARTNVILRRYCMLVVFVAVLLGGVFAIGFKVTADEKAAANSAKAEGEQNAAQFQEVRKAAEDFSKDLAIAKTILGSDVPFSQLITDIASVIPPGVILSNLSLNAAQQNAPITINAKAKTYDDAIKLKNNLEGSPIFESVNIVSITSSQGQASDTGPYPLTVSVSVKFSKITTAKGAS